MLRNVLVAATIALLVVAAGAPGPAAGQGALPRGGPDRRIPPDGRRPRPTPPPASAPTITSEPATMPETQLASMPADMEKGPWSDFQAGTAVKYELAGDMTQTRQFVRADSNSVTIRTTTSVQGARPTEGRYPRWYTVAELKKAMDGFGTKTGEEGLKVGEKDLWCEVYTKTMSFGRTKVITKTWLCKEVPGWTVRVDNDASGEMKTIQRVVQYTPAASGE